MPGRALARKAAAIIAQSIKDQEEAQARWAAVPQERKDKLDLFLEAHRKNPIGLIYK